MNYFSYRMDHDYGLAPNPFGKFCTLAVCKPQIRSNKKLEIGDWIIGTGSKKLGNVGKLIYCFQLEERITFQEYWDDSRFQYKKPHVNGSLVQMYGDNFYHQGKDGEWVQENSAHSLNGGRENLKHKKTDLKGKYVLISQEFYYLGDKCIEIPEKYIDICSPGRPILRKKISDKLGSSFVRWVKNHANIKKGVNGDPINWTEHAQLCLFTDD